MRDEFAADFGEMHGNDLTRIRRAECDAFFARTTIMEHGHEERFAGEQAFASAE